MKARQPARRLRLLFATLASAGLALPAQANPAGLPTGQGGRATANVHLLAKLPTGTRDRGSVPGTTYFQTSADTLWFNAVSTQVVSGGLLSIDASNPEQPRVTGALPIPHHENEDLTLSTRRHLAVISQPYRSNPTAAPALTCWERSSRSTTLGPRRWC